MAEGWGTTLANGALDQLDGSYIQLHTGAPGAAGTANVASNSTRKAVTFGAASAGSKTTTADILWSAVGAAEAYTKFTLWSAASSGTFRGSGTITANAVAIGDDFKLAAGNLTMSTPVAS